MPALTRHRSDNPHHETWHVYYAGVHVGTIRQRAGVPHDVDQWGWSCGFYPGLNPGQHRTGTAAAFDLTRAAFERAWHELLPEIPEGAFNEWRDDRAFKANIRAKRARGEKLDSEIPSSVMRCVCGVRFDGHVLSQNLIHLPHIYAAQAVAASVPA